MSLEVTIEKKVADFRLSVEFMADGGPLGLLGASGSGKTMTLRAIAGLETPDRGRIVLHGRVLFDSNKRINIPTRNRRIGFLFQNFALFPHLTVSENITFGLRRVATDERIRRVKQQLAGMHLEDLGHRYPATLSGGEQQRVALARALAIEPDALLLDEPFSALDTHLRGALERQLHEVLGRYQGSTLFVSHNLEEAYRICEKLVVMTKGTVAAQGSKEEIFRYPPAMEVARLTGCKNFSRACRLADGKIEAPDWGCVLRVAQQFPKSPAHVAIRAHHVRVRVAAVASQEACENTLPCRLVSMTETPFRVTLDLRVEPRTESVTDLNGGQLLAGSGSHQIQAEVFRQEWESLRDVPQPWQIELPVDRLFLLPD